MADEYQHGTDQAWDEHARKELEKSMQRARASARFWRRLCLILLILLALFLARWRQIHSWEDLAPGSSRIPTLQEFKP